MPDAGSASVLIVEDDEGLAPLIARHLRESNFDVDWANSISTAWAALQVNAHDVVVLDIMLPDGDGLSLCRRIHQELDLPVIMVTAKGETSDRIRGLQIGADDYLPKPFSLWELEARIRAVLRRWRKSRAEPQEILQFGDLAIDCERRIVEVGGVRLELTRSEFDLLVKLVTRPGTVFSRDQLMECIKGGGTDAFDRAVDTHISNLRRKVESDPKAPRYIKTVWGIGYKFEI